MRPINEASHLLLAFRQLDDAGRLNLVRRMRGVALRRLAGLTPRGFNADDADHCIVAALTIEGSKAPAQAKAAARLLRACAHAMEAPAGIDAPALVLQYSQLDARAAERDAVMQRGRSTGGKNKPAKLPQADVLRAVVAQVQGARGVSEADAKGIVRKRYGASSQAVNRKLKKS